MIIHLRDPIPEDLPIFFVQQLEPAAVLMAAFPSREKDAFMSHWAKTAADPANLRKTILADGLVAGYVASFMRLEDREVCYWLGKEAWGKGIATKALADFLEIEIRRPLWARVAKSNPASVRVLEKCGFTIVGEDKYSNSSGTEVKEFVLKLGSRMGQLST